MPDKPMTIEEVAKYLGVTPRTIQRYVAGEYPGLELTGYKIGKSWRFKQGDVEDFEQRLRAHTQNQKKAS